MLFKVPQDARHTSASQPLGVTLTAASLLCSFCQNQKHLYQHCLHFSNDGFSTLFFANFQDCFQRRLFIIKPRWRFLVFWRQ